MLPHPVTSPHSPRHARTRHVTHARATSRNVTLRMPRAKVTVTLSRGHGHVLVLGLLHEDHVHT
eukprot:2770504-Rhodomonas_salina.1